MSIVAASLLGLTALTSAALSSLKFKRDDRSGAALYGVMALLWLGLSVAVAANS